MRIPLTLTLTLTLGACIASPADPTQPTPAGWHEPTTHDAELVRRLSDYLANVAGPIAPVCSDDGVTCCSFVDATWCCCSFVLGCACGISTP